jgi:hemerythrin-like domain-containing protein
MKITDRLKVEHGVFLLQLRAIEELLAAAAPAPVLAAAVTTVAAAEAHHSTIEDRLLYPALIRALGKESPVLREVEAEHGRIHRLVESIRRGEGGADSVASFVSMLREHLEKEIHSLFAVADEVLSPEQLQAMCNWDLEHVYEAAGHREAWLGKLRG